MKRITPEIDLHGNITGYTVSDVSDAEIHARGLVAEWILNLPFKLLCLAISPIMFFVTSYKLIKERKTLRRNKRRLIKLVVEDIIFLSFGILQICTFCLLLDYLEMINIPFL